MTDDSILRLLNDAADAVAAALATHDDWGLVGGVRDDEYKHDVVADAAALSVLEKAPVGILSEESGLKHGDRDVVVVVDPVDGSTNASLGLPWYATSLCAVDGDGLRASVVVNLPLGTRFTAVRGGGATVDGKRIDPPKTRALADAIIVINGWQPPQLRPKLMRIYGAAALDMCAVATGTFDAFVSCTPWPMLGAWDYLGAMLVCLEAGVTVRDRDGEDLIVLDPKTKRSPIAASSPALLEECIKSLNK